MNHKMTQQLNWQRDDFENDFTAWEGDLWERKRLGEQLTSYVDRLQCGAVLALDARWGEGKTWFVRHWKRHLETTEIAHNVIYLDAFANDYLDDPFLTIAAEISHALKDADEIADADIQDFNSKTASVLISLAAVMPLIAAKAGLHWVGLGGAGEALQEVYKEGKEVYDTASEEIAHKVKEQIEKKIENHHIEKQTIQDFKQELAQLANKLDKPLVFIIDELDRCRPDFAIRLIERIKHFFDIHKIVFILVMNKPQLSQSVKSFYDSEMNGDYFEKFIDFTVHMSSESDIYDFEEVIKYQLFRIGELDSLDDRSELFYWTLGLQLDKKFNSRELIKKLNKYALLRTADHKKNLILLSLIMGQEPYVNYHIFISSVVKKINAYLCTDKHRFMQRHNLSTWGSNGIDSITESEWFRLILEKDLDITDTFIDKLLAAYERAKKSNDPEYQLIDTLKNVSIIELDHSSNFIKDWQSYIHKGL